MKAFNKYKFLGIITALMASPVCLAAYPANVNDGLFSLKLDIGAAITAGKVRSPFSSEKIKFDSSPAFALSGAYAINDYFSVIVEGGIIPFLRGKSNTNTEVRELSNNLIPRDMLSSQVANNPYGYWQGLNNVVSKLDFDHSILKNSDYQALILKVVNPGRNVNDINNLMEKIIPLVKNKISISTTEKIINSTLMIGGEIEAFKNEAFKFSVGAKLGLASNILRSGTNITLNYKDGSKSNLHINDKTHKISPAYGLHLRAAYKINENLDFGLTYGFKDIGKVKRHIDIDHKKSKTTKQKVHLITGNISFNF